MDTTLRRYTVPEINALLDQLREPVAEHHASIGLLLAMAMVLEHIYTLRLPEGEVPWMDDLVPVLQRELMSGLAEVTRVGVLVPTTGSQPVN